ncbi:cytochrome P450 [Panus rudis PR-1116 ss-1]|nr:cytochrome P450 [Panus rudis PR-1116 ss-1]
MAESLVSTYILAGLLPILYLLYRWRYVNLYDIPTIGTSAPILSYLGARKYARHAREMLEEGYAKYKGGVFKIATYERWIVVVNGPRMVDELRKFPDDQVSFMEAAEDLVHISYTFGDFDNDPFHIEIVRGQLTRYLASLFGDIRDEIVAAYNDLIPPSDDWTPIDVLPTMQHIVARVSNRIFVGLPLCRHKEYIDLSIKHTIQVIKTKDFLNQWPELLQPIAGFFVDESRRSVKVTLALLQPTIDERMNKAKELGDDWNDKPNDLLQWVIDLALEKGKSMETVAAMILSTNFAAIHTSSNSFTHAIYWLAACPEYMKPLREEVEAVVKEEGWTKAALQKMKKLDSFMRESLRVSGLGSLSLIRKTIKPITLSTGHRIPPGHIIVATSAAMHLDEEHYPNPEVFDPFRFSDLRDGDTGEATKHQYVSTSSDYIPFGHGKHACPGRFFAANELKAMLAHTIVAYDVKFEEEGVRPENIWVAESCIPNPSTPVLFRRRRD